MTHRERLSVALKGGRPDRVPCWPKATRWVRYHYGCPCPRHQARIGRELDLDMIVFYPSYIWQSLGNDYVYSPGGGFASRADGLYGDLEDVEVDIRVRSGDEQVTFCRTFRTPGGELHDVIEWARPNRGYGDGPNPHRVEPLVKDRADLAALPHLYPAPRKDLLEDAELLLEDLGDEALLSAIDTTHAGSWGMEALGPEGMLTAAVQDVELLRGVCELANDCHIRNLQALLDRGLEVVYDSWFQCGPSVGWSPRTFTEVFLPLIRECVEAVHDLGGLYIYQDDGRMRDIIPEIVDAGVDVVAGLQPPGVGDVNLGETKRAFGDRVALCGGLDPCYTFDRGSPEAVREAVRLAIEDAGAGGGYVLSTAEAVSPETPRECLVAAREAALEFGVYDSQV